MRYFLCYTETLGFNGFYIEGIHGEIPSKTIEVTKELREHLLSLSKFKFKSIPQEKILDISHINLFEEVVDEIPPTESGPSLHDKVELLEEHNVNTVATMWDIDFRVCEVEWTLEDAGIGANPINLKIKGANTMALSRYEQAKIMIIGGVYDKETLTRQLSTYLKRGYITQEEYDELIALMEAKELVAGK